MKKHQASEPAKALTTEQQIVLEAAAKYALPNGSIDWSKAVEENPGWKDHLQYESHQEGRNFQRASNIANTLRNRGLLERSTIGKPAKKRAKFSAAARAKIGATQKKRWAERRADRLAAALGEAAPLFEPNGNGHTERQTLTEADLAKLVQKRVNETMDQLIREAACCSKCGKSMVEQLRRELHTIRFDKQL